ncbi:hypothetical protein ACJX0J_019992, partial [Zea mays]
RFIFILVVEDSSCELDTTFGSTLSFTLKIMLLFLIFDNWLVYLYCTTFLWKIWFILFYYFYGPGVIHVKMAINEEWKEERGATCLGPGYPPDIWMELMPQHSFLRPSFLIIMLSIKNAMKNQMRWIEMNIIAGYFLGNMKQYNKII